MCGTGGARRGNKALRCQTSEGCLLLRVVRAPYRVPAPPEPEAPDPTDAYEALLRARTLRGRHVATLVSGVLAGLSILALAEAPSSAPQEPSEVRAMKQIANAREAIALASRRALEEDAHFVEAI